jgi:endonuclease YncB( thermonuclease family)
MGRSIRGILAALVLGMAFTTIAEEVPPLQLEATPIPIVDIDAKTEVTYAVSLVKIVDGDTIDVSIKIWDDIVISKRVRFSRVNTPELRSSDRSERRKAVEARDFVKGRLEAASKILIVTAHKRGKYGRLIAGVLYRDKTGSTHDLEAELLKANLAEKYGD